MRGSGILLPVSSLPGAYGIGSFGREAYRFVDFLAAAGQKYWEILPLGPTSYGDSPYQTLSAYAGNPYYIDLEWLADEGLAEPKKLAATNFGADPSHVDYGAVYQSRNEILATVADRFSEQDYPDFPIFCRDNRMWLDDYAIFMALKEENGGRCWNTLSEDLKYHRAEAVRQAQDGLSDAVRKHRILQYLFFRQWKALKQYANEKGIRIFGDMPIYISYDSSDVWSAPWLFELDTHLNTVNVAGCPPDAFSPLGQRWGNPLYAWEKEKDDVFRWWIRRMEHAARLYDWIRIDHFRGFADYYAIPSYCETATVGEWRTGPGQALFDALQKALGALPIVAEDLGFLNDRVRQLLAYTGFPNMKVLQFAFDSDSAEQNEYLPHRYSRNCVVYLGTHDNDTTRGWFEKVRPADADYAKRYLRIAPGENPVYGMIKAALASVADTVILTMQDLLNLGSEARINTPSTPSGNWVFRLPGDYAERVNVSELREYVRLYGRL